MEPCRGFCDIKHIVWYDNSSKGDTGLLEEQSRDVVGICSDCRSILRITRYRNVSAQNLETAEARQVE